MPCLAAVFLVFTGNLAFVGSAEFQAGFATRDITPPVGWRRAGSYSELVSTGVHDPLFAKAWVLSQGSCTVVVVGNDLCSVPRELKPPPVAAAHPPAGQF